MSASVSVREWPDNKEEGYNTMVFRTHWKSENVIVGIDGKEYTFRISGLRKALMAIEVANDQ